MLGELVHHYGITTIFAVAKERNLRSLGLLARLGFMPADSGIRVQRGVEPDEALMILEVERA